MQIQPCAVKENKPSWKDMKGEHMIILFEILPQEGGGMFGLLIQL